MTTSAASHTPRAKDRTRKSTASKAGRLRSASPRPFLALAAEPAPDPSEPNTVSPIPEPPTQITDPPS